MRQTAVINIRVEPTVKKQAHKIAEDLGFSLSSLVNGYLHNLIKTKRVYYPPEEPSQYLIRSIKQSERNLKRGYISPPFSNAKDAMAWLKNPKAKYARDL
ncbi:MAG: type II toxin-antitoxin system RelB/DinJ family antitoxin [Candidatus Gottesmanbacteria bacterium]|nr:type II toxin-antitoxin system RelB/DinJ family antitoxin [Candidatus Gottesmanbacteria bacterium]